MKRAELIEWNQIKESVKNSNTQLFDKIEGIDDVLPPFIKASYSYADHIIKDSTFIHDHPLLDKHIGYAKIPIFMPIQKQLSYYRYNVYEEMFKPGFICGLDIFKSNNNIRQDENMFAGSESVFLTEKFSNYSYFEKLNKEYHHEFHIPKSHKEHTIVFRELVKLDETLQKSWQAEIIIFTSEWFNRIMHNNKYRDLKEFLISEVGERLRYSSNLYYKYAHMRQDLSGFLKTANYKLHIHQLELLEQIINIHNGFALGYRTLVSEEAFPLAMMKEILETYYLKSSVALFMNLSHICSRQAPIYYSLGNMQLTLGDENFHSIKSHLQEMLNLKFIINNLLKDDQYHILDNCRFNYYHPSANKQADGVLHPSLIDNDVAIKACNNDSCYNYKSSFWRGLIQMNAIEA